MIAQPAVFSTSNINDRMNVIRFVAIASVVWGHCLLGLENKSFLPVQYQVGQAVLIQGGRVGTIMFFIISGFFLNDKMGRFTPFSYLKYRFKPLIMPWMIFVLLITLVQWFDEVSITEIFAGHTGHALFVFWALVKGAVFHAAYWFIPVTIISSMVLIVLKKQINSTWLVLLLVCISLFYSVNLYEAWIPVTHTKALFGYVFYMWIGMQVSRNIETVKYLLHKVPGVGLFFLTIIVFLFACREGANLTRLGCPDAYASLRISNAILSVMIFMALLKSHRLAFFTRLKPQSKAYGLYLVHSLVITQIVPFADRIIREQNLSSSLPALTLIQVIVFILVFGFSYGIVSALRRSFLGFMIGARKTYKEPVKTATGAVNATG